MAWEILAMMAMSTLTWRLLTKLVVVVMSTGEL